MIKLSESRTTPEIAKMLSSLSRRREAAPPPPPPRWSPSGATTRRDSKPGARPLFWYQDNALRYLRRRDSLGMGGCLFMEMRLGKTLSMIRHMMERGYSRVVVSAPLTVCRTWLNELREEGFSDDEIEYTPDLSSAKFDDYTMRIRGCRGTEPKLVTIVSHARLTSASWQRFGPVDALIVDESVVLANPDNVIASVCCSGKYWPFVAPSCRVFCLAGVPAPESELQLFNQVAPTQGGRFMGSSSYWSFRAREFEIRGFRYEAKRESKRNIAEALHTDAFCLTRSQAGIGSRKFYEKRFVRMPASHRAVYDGMLEDWAVGDKITETAPVRALWLQRISGGHDLGAGGGFSHHKCEEVASLLQGDLKGQQVIVWFRFRDELDECRAFVEREVPEIRGKCLSINGSTKPSDREKFRQCFMDGALLVAFMMIQTQKRGSDWSAASASIYYSNDYSNEARMQSEDRVIHPEKTEPVLYIDLCTEDTADEDCVSALVDKKLSVHLLMRFIGRLSAKARASKKNLSDARAAMESMASEPDDED